MVTYDRKAYKAKAVGDYGTAAEAFMDNYLKAIEAGDEDLARMFLEEALRCQAVHSAITRELRKENLPELLRERLFKRDKGRPFAERFEDELRIVQNKFDDQISRLEVRSMKKEYLRRFERISYPSNKYYLSLEHLEERVQIHGFNRSDTYLNHNVLGSQFGEFEGKFPFEVTIEGITFMIDSDGSFEAIEPKEKIQVLKGATLNLPQFWKTQ